MLPSGMEAMRTPTCTECNRKFEKIEYFNIHMTNVHKETPDHRLTKTIEQVQAQETSVQEEEEEEENNQEDDDHFTEKFWGDDTSKDTPSSYKMTGNSAEFQDATDKLRKSLKKGATVRGEEATANIKDVRATGPGTQFVMEIVGKKKEKGNIRLTYWPKNKKTKDIKVIVNNVAGNDKTLVSVLTEQILKPFIKMSLNGQCTDSLFKNPLDQKVRKRFTCEMCRKYFQTETLMNNHMDSVHRGDPGAAQLKEEIVHIVNKSSEDIQQQLKEATKTPEKQKYCAVCKLFFSTDRTLREHIRGVHSGHLLNIPSSFKQDRLTSEHSLSSPTTPPPK